MTAPQKVSEVKMVGEEEENQFLLFLRNSFFKVLDTVFQYTILTIHYFFLPSVFIYSFWAYAFDQTWQISKNIASDMIQLLKIVPLTIELWFWSGMILMEGIFLMKSNEEMGVEVEQRIYHRIKTILNILNALPLTPMNGASLYSVLDKVPIFGKAIPFPHFLFEQTFTRIKFKKGSVEMDIPATNEEPSTSGTTITESAEEISTGESKKSDSKTTFIQRKRSGEKVTDSTKSESTKSSTLPPASSDQPTPKSSSE